MAAYRRVYESRHLQADCQEPGSDPEPYARQSAESSMGYLTVGDTTPDGRRCLPSHTRNRRRDVDRKHGRRQIASMPVSQYNLFKTIIIPAKAREYVFTGVGLSVCLSVCLFVTTITK